MPPRRERRETLPTPIRNLRHLPVGGGGGGVVGGGGGESGFCRIVRKECVERREEKRRRTAASERRAEMARWRLSRGWRRSTVANQRPLHTRKGRLTGTACNCSGSHGRRAETERQRRWQIEAQIQTLNFKF